ncbi:MAG: helix-turn-helix transcriptional regulator [Candidatus Eremiobacteraeota bacterium]|nr:helix-turn-helix transcriptional regulator [Candidatus Eremiobacteraeota bacterium]
MEALNAELILQQRHGVNAPWAGRTRLDVSPYRSSLTCVLGTPHRIYGILLVLRAAGEPSFNREDVTALEEVLEPATRGLSRLPAFDGEQAVAIRVSQRSFPAVFVLNRELTIEYAWSPYREDDVLSTMLDLGDRLPPAIETAVHNVTDSWTDDPQTWQEAVAIPLPFVVVRVMPLKDTILKIGVLVERYLSRNPLQWAIRRFGMSEREVQVLGLLLQGKSSNEIAEALMIAESTVHDHIKRLLVKTRARNRVELAAKALGWQAV